MAEYERPVSTSYMGGPSRYDWASYKEANPEVFQPGYSWYTDPKYGLSPELQSAWRAASGPMTPSSYGWPEEAEIAGLTELLKQFAGGTSTFIRWLINKKVSTLSQQLADKRRAGWDIYKVRQRQQGQLEQGEIESGIIRPKEEGWERQFVNEEGVEEWADYDKYGEGIIGQERVERFGATPRSAGRPEYAGAPVPGWMRPYLDPSVSGVPAVAPQSMRKRGLPAVPQSAEQGMLRPLGAQAKATPEQMEEMAGYLGWHKAGSPTQYSESALMAMADWQRHFEEYTRLSQSLFPTRAKLGSRWATARQ